MKRVVVTGMGIVSPIGNDVATFWRNVLDGKNGIDRITKFDTTNFKVKLAAEVKDFDPEKYFEKLESRKIDAFSQYAIVAASEAMEDSKLHGEIKNERLGVYVGSGIGGMTSMISQIEVMREKGPSRVSAILIPMMISNIAAAHIAIKNNAKGPCLPVVTACATSAHSIGEAFFAVRDGRADAILAGGAESAICDIGIAGFMSCMALSTSEDPNAASIPFDKRRSGFVMGEGAGILVLEEYEHAKKRGAKIYAELVGYANTCDAFHITAPHSEGEGCIRMYDQALEMAQVKPEEKIYINLHGTGTELNDKIETAAVKAVFGERAKNIPMSSTKSMTGHLLGAAGAAEAIICIKALNDGYIPPTINLESPDPECDLDYVPHKKREFTADVAITVSLGFGGHNAGIIFRKVKD